MALLCLINIRSNSDLLQSLKSRRGLLQALSQVTDNEWELGNRFDSVTVSLNKRWDHKSSNGRNDGVSFLVHIYPPMPKAPDLGRSEYATTMAHVPESSLTSTMSTTVGDTGHGTCSRKLPDKDFFFFFFYKFLGLLSWI